MCGRPLCAACDQCLDCWLTDLETAANHVLSESSSTDVMRPCAAAGRPGVPAFPERFKEMFKGMRLSPRGGDVATGARKAQADAVKAEDAAAEAVNIASQGAQDAVAEVAAKQVREHLSESHAIRDHLVRQKDQILQKVASAAGINWQEFVDAMGKTVLESIIDEVATVSATAAPFVRTTKEAALTTLSGGMAGYKVYARHKARKQEPQFSEGPGQAALACVPRCIGRAITQWSIDAGRHGAALAASLPADAATILSLAGIPLTFGGSAIILPVSEGLLGTTLTAANAVASLCQRVYVMMRDFKEAAIANDYLKNPDKVHDTSVFEEAPILGLWWLLLASDYELSSMPIRTATELTRLATFARLKNRFLRGDLTTHHAKIFEWVEHREVVRSAAFSLTFAHDWVLVRETDPLQELAGIPDAKGKGKLKKLDRAKGYELVRPLQEPSTMDRVSIALPRRLNVRDLAWGRMKQAMSLLSADSPQALMDGMEQVVFGDTT
jgi:hypothetical protein